MRKIKIFILIIFFGICFILRNEIKNFYLKFTLRLPAIEREIGRYLQPEIKREVFLPPPIRGEKEYPKSFLTKEGIIKWTNAQREKYGLPSLKENSLLSVSAAIKIEDMFENQYFSHYSPTGKGIEDLAKTVNYEFIFIGENLALGNFKDDEALVLAWMESPGHRENILNEKYQEIGVAVKKGIFEGKEVWLAVQHFGLPLSVCPKPDEKLKREIQENEAKINELLEKLNILESEIKKKKPKWGKEYENQIKDYNFLVEEYNSLVGKTQILIDSYNLQVQSFNECLRK